MVDRGIALLFCEQCQILKDLIVEDPIAAANHRLARPVNIPRKPDARLKLLITAGCLAQQSRIARKRLSASIGKLTEDLHRAVVGLINQKLYVRIPTQTKIQSQAGSNFVVVLNIKRQLVKRWLTSVARSSIKGYFVDSAGSGETP